MSSPLHLAPFGTALLVATLVLSGCGAKDESPSEPTAGVSPSLGPSTGPTSPATDSGSPTPSPTPTGTTTASPASLGARLLPATSVPGLNARGRWTVARTTDLGTDPTGACDKVDLLSIGATGGTTRTYNAADGSLATASETIAEVPDTATAVRVEAVLKSWLKGCGKRLSNADYTARVGALTPVTVSKGTAGWYLVTGTPTKAQGGDDGLFIATGFVRSGLRIAVLVMSSKGQDYNYPAGREPMVAMTRAAADLLR